MKTTWQTGILVSAINLMLASCGFHLRSQENLPPLLHQVYFISEASNVVLDQKIKTLFTSLGIRLTDSPNKAGVILKISHYNFTHSQPNTTNSNQPTNYTDTLSVAYQLLSKTGKALTPEQFLSVSYTQMMSVNQIYTHMVDPFVERRLQKEMMTLLYDQLISERIHRVLRHTS